MQDSVQFSHSVVSDSLQPHESQHTRPPCPSPTLGVYPNSGPSSRVMPSNHLILCHPLLLLPPIPLSIRVFSNESTLCMRWPKYWSFSFSIFDYAKDFDCVDHNKLWKILKEMGIPDHLTCLLRNLYAAGSNS